MFTYIYIFNFVDEFQFPARNLTEEERNRGREITWDDKEVCGHYMVRFCPFDLFANTRSDLGALLLNFILNYTCLTVYLVAEKEQARNV